MRVIIAEMKIFLRCWLPVLLWMVVIFLISADSNPYHKLPGAWKEFLLAEESAPAWQSSLSRTEILGRSGHLLEYMLLGGLAARAFSRSLPRLRTAALLGQAVLFSTVYALSDEIHQIFVPERGFQWSDLALDAAGSLTGALIFLLLYANLLKPKLRALLRAKDPIEPDSA